MVIIILNPKWLLQVVLLKRIPENSAEETRFVKTNQENGKTGDFFRRLQGSSGLTGCPTAEA